MNMLGIEEPFSAGKPFPRPRNPDMQILGRRNLLVEQPRPSSSIWTERRDSHIEGMSDLANGSGGMFRYLYMAHDLSLNKYEHKFPFVARAPFSLPVLFFPESFRKHTYTHTHCLHVPFAAISRYVTEVALWRDDSHHDQVPHGWNGKTSDINDGRGGDFVYLVWKTKDYLGPR